MTRETYWQSRATALHPDPLLTVSEWADQRRILSRKSSSEHGQWKTSRTPYLRKPMDDLSVTSPVTEVVMVFGSQLGKSESLNNWIGYTMDIAPGPALFVQPTIDLAKRYSKMRIAPMIESTPTLRDKVRTPRERDSGNTVLMKEYPGGLTIFGGANAASGLASMPIRYLAGDEIDRWPLSVDDEGSPVAIVTARTRTFGARKKHAWTSSPTIYNRSAIWAKWEQSNQQRLKLPCPHCGHRQTIEWDRIRYDNKDPLLPSALSRPPVLICEECGTGIEEDAKSWWYNPDVWNDDWWEADRPEIQIQGYHLNSFYSPLGWYSWTDAVLEYEKAKDTPLELQAWMNTVCALCWMEDGEAPAWEELYRRREQYPIGTVPPGGLLLTAGCDVQRNRLEVEIVAWGPNMQSWSVEYLIFEGDTGTVQEDESVKCPWRELSKLLTKQWPTADGGTLPLARLAVDSGDQTQVVYGWVRAQHDSRVMATKGMDSQTGLLGMPKAQDVTVRGKLLKGGVKVWPLGSSTGKRELYGWLKIETPTGDETYPRGWCHFPEYPDEYFQGLTAEQLLCKTVRGFPKWVWEKVRTRNEPLDCRVMARAALSAIGGDRWTAEQWAARASRVGMKMAARIQKAPPSPAAAAPTAAPAAAPRRRRRASSGWLSDGGGGVRGGRGGGSWLR
jgi:phage terminase large subunit GpA-like protein